MTKLNMKYFALLFFLGAAYSSDVIELTDSNFKTQVDDKSMLLIEFFAPWCGHCKKLAPEYETAATALAKNDPPIPIAKADCVGEAKESCQKYGVSGYPTLKIFRNGEFSQEYDGPRDASGIISYMKKNSGPSSVELKDSEHLQKKIDTGEEILIAGFFKNEGSVEPFMKVADSLRNDYNFAHTTDAAIIETSGHSDVIVLYRPKHLHAKFEDPKMILDTGIGGVDTITEFIKKNRCGLVGQISPDKEANFADKKPLVIAYYKVDWKRNLKGSRYWRNRVARVAKKFIGEIHFAIASKSDYASKMSDWGFTEDDEVAAVVQNEKGLFFKMTEKFSVPALETFVNTYKSGTLKPYIKSEPLPAKNDEPVKVLVGENFDEIVNDPTKDVLIEFYAPWCGHCKSLEPKYNELAEKLKDNKDIVIAKMDATANDSPPQFEVSGFPTLYWSGIGKKDSPKKYQGGREVTDFIEYIKREAKNPVTVSEKKKKKKDKKKDNEEL